MNDTITNTIDEALTELGPDIKEAAYNTAWDYVSREIASKHKLSPTKANILSAETGMYLAYIIDFKEYLEEIQKLCDEDPELFRSLLIDLTTEILEPYTHYLKANKEEVKELINDIDIENREIELSQGEDAEPIDIPIAPNTTLIKIPIKRKISNEPTITVKKEQDFSPLQKPSTYTKSTDPYHEEL